MDKTDEIRQFLQSVCAFDEEALEECIESGKTTLLKKGEYFISAGQICRSFAFVHTGIFSFLLMTNEGERVKDFSGSQKILTSYTSFITQTPSRIFIRAEQDAELTTWSHQLFNIFLDKSLQWKEFAYRMANYLYMRKENREISLLTESAAERYIHLQNEFPSTAIAQLLPQYLIASYLGIKPQSLSRIRQKLVKRRN